MFCAKELTEYGEIGEVFEKIDPGFSCGTNSKKRRANLKRSQTQIGQVAEEHAAAQQEDTQLQDLISSKCGAKQKLLWHPVQAEAELYGLVRASAETMGLISMYKDLGTHMNGVVLGDASAALAIVARRGLGKLRHLDTNYLWIQEKAAKGDLNFKKVAGVDNGADLFTKTLSWNEIQNHIHKLSSQFVQNEINVNYVGARPNGVNLTRVLQELGVAGDRNLAAWTRTDVSSRTRQTTMKGGRVRSDVIARVTADAVSG